MGRLLPLAGADDVAGAGKARLEPAAPPYRGAAKMIEMEMGGEHDVDAVGRESGGRQRLVQRRGRD